MLWSKLILAGSDGGWVGEQGGARADARVSEVTEPERSRRAEEEGRRRKNAKRKLNVVREIETEDGANREENTDRSANSTCVSAHSDLRATRAFSE